MREKQEVNLKLHKAGIYQDTWFNKNDMFSSPTLWSPELNPAPCSFNIAAARHIKRPLGQDLDIKRVRMQEEDHKGANHRGNTGVAVHKGRGSEDWGGHSLVSVFLLPLTALSIFTSLKKKKKA